MRNSLLIIALCVPILAMSAVTPVAKTLYMKDTDMARVTVALGRSTILSFPTRPSKVVLGNKNLFAVEYIESDLAISALIPRARSNLVVYLQGRRFSANNTHKPSGIGPRWRNLAFFVAMEAGNIGHPPPAIHADT